MSLWLKKSLNFITASYHLPFSSEPSTTPINTSQVNSRKMKNGSGGQVHLFQYKLSEATVP